MFTEKRDDLVEFVCNKRLRPVRRDGVFILLDEIKTETISPGGVILVSKTMEGDGIRKGTIISVGDKVVGLKILDRVLLSKYYGNEIPYEYSSSCRLIFVSADQIDATVEDDD